MNDARTYPHGVPCWVDVEQPDPEAARRFYGSLLGWTFSDAVPSEAPGSYWIASLESRDVAAIAPGSDGAVAWNTYVAVDDADATASLIASRGGAIVSEPQDAGPGGRAATCTDPTGAPFRLWQARARLDASESSPHWHVTFAVGDRDDAVAAAERLGASVLSSADSEWTRSAEVRDPQGAELTLSQFTPPTG